MSLELYDKALKEKLENVFPNVILAPPDDAFSRSNEDGKVKLPLISAWRLSNPINFEEFNHYETFTGRRSRQLQDNMVLTEGLPITITYQIDIWAQKREYADGIYRELVYYLMTNPNLQLKIPSVDSPVDFSMKLTDVDTSTDYASFDSNNIVHRYTLTYEVPYAKLFFEHDSAKLVKSIPITLIMNGGTNDVIKINPEKP